jgi:hypothetical protein
MFDLLLSEKISHYFLLLSNDRTTREIVYCLLLNILESRVKFNPTFLVSLLIAGRAPGFRRKRRTMGI